MATITKRGPYQYQAIIRRVGCPTQTKTLESKRDAQDWANAIETDMRRGVFVDLHEAERTTLDDLLERYKTEVTPKKRGARPETYRLGAMQRHPIALLRLTALRAVDFTNYMNERLEEVSPKSVREELVLFSSVLKKAAKAWSIPVINYIHDIERPSGTSVERVRRLSGDEEARLMDAVAGARKDSELRAIVTLAIETGMRASEITGLMWSHVDLKNHVLTLPFTKNGDSRTVPLTMKAEQALQSLPRNIDGKVFTFNSRGLGDSFAAACMRAGIENFRFHDLRHEAASRLAPRMRVHSLAKIMGWRTLQMAMRYYNPNDKELVALVRAA